METESAARKGRGVPDKRQAIVEAAVRLFSRHGFERTTTRMIAREAKVAEGTIYLYFPGKKDILLTFIKPVALESLRDALEEMKGLPDEEVVYRLLLNRFRLWETHRDLIKAVIAQAFFDPDLAESFRKEVILPLTGLIERFVAWRIREGGWRDIDPHIAARALVGQSFASVLLYDFLLGGPEAGVGPETLAANLTRLFLEGIR